MCNNLLPREEVCHAQSVKATLMCHKTSWQTCTACLEIGNLQNASCYKSVALYAHTQIHIKQKFMLTTKVQCPARASKM